MKKEQTPSPQVSKKEKLRNLVYHEVSITIVAVTILTLILGGIAYLQVQSSRVYIEKAEIEGPLISLKSSGAGVLEEVYVKEGDQVSINTVVAQVGNESIRTRTAGIVTFVKNTPGQYVTSQDMLVQMIDPQQLRVVGHLEENKGLSEVKPGQNVIFTVDAFGSKEYVGVVDLVSPTSRESDIVFSISDKREQKQFDVKATFDPTQYPELKNGMSVKMWVYK